jgi:hypothetical protein
MLRNQRALLPLAILDYYWLPGNIPMAMNRVIMAAKSVPITNRSVRYRRKPQGGGFRG